MVMLSIGLLVSNVESYLVQKVMASEGAGAEDENENEKPWWEGLCPL